MPEKPKLPTIFDIIRLNMAARMVQNRWVIKQYERRFLEEHEQSDKHNRFILTLLAICCKDVSNLIFPFLLSFPFQNVHDQ